MSEVASAIQAALDSDSAIPRDLVAEWCQAAEDVRSLALLYRLTGDAYERIQPLLGQVETCRLIQKYLLTCLRLDPEDGVGFSRYQAAWTLLGWFQHLSRLPDTSLILREAASAVTQLYLEGDATCARPSRLGSWSTFWRIKSSALCSQAGSRTTGCERHGALRWLGAKRIPALRVA